jgi:hypothetical protein
MTTTTDDEVLIHFLGSITFVTELIGHGFGRVSEYGDELTLTQELRHANTDRNGDCFFDLLDDDEAQTKRWGKVLFRRGPWPEGKRRYEPGSDRWREERDAALQAAWKIENEDKRNRLLMEIAAEYGPLLTSRTIATYSCD